MNTFNTTDEVVYLTPKTAMVNARARKLIVRNLGRDPRILSTHSEEEDDFGARLREEIMQKYPKVGDFSSHPINDKLAKLGVRAMEVKWTQPPDRSVRTQYQVESVANRHKVHNQLQDYVRRGYLTDVSVGDNVYFNPLLPICKPNSTFRFTNDF